MGGMGGGRNLTKESRRERVSQKETGYLPVIEGPGLKMRTVTSTWEVLAEGEGPGRGWGRSSDAVGYWASP